MIDPELNVLYYISYLKANREKVKVFLQWGKECNVQNEEDRR